MKAEGKQAITLWLNRDAIERLQAQAQAFGVTVPELIARLSEQLLQEKTRLEGLHDQRIALKAERARLEARIQALLDRYPSSKVAAL